MSGVIQYEYVDLGSLLIEFTTVGYSQMRDCVTLYGRRQQWVEA